MNKILLGHCADKLIEGNMFNTSARAQGKDGKWYLARPLMYKSPKATLIRLWDVLTGKADLLYWNIDNHKK